MVGIRKSKKSLADQIAALSNPAGEDMDPEGMTDAAFTSYKDDVDYESDEFESVGPSRLRNQQMAEQNFGEEYSGVKSSRRNVLEEDSEEEDENEEDAFESGSEEEGDVIDVGEESESDVEGVDSNMDTDSDNNGEEEMIGFDNEEDETAQHLQEQLASFGQSAGVLLTSQAKKGKNDAQKGKQVTNQLKNWDTMFETRIKLQKLLAMANQFPQHDVYEEFIKQNNSLMYKLNDVAGDIENELLSLFDIQHCALKGNEETRNMAMDKSVKKARKRLREDDASVDEYWAYIEKMNLIMDPYNRSVIDKWNEKTQLASGGTALQNKKFKALNQNVVNQIDQIMLDEGRLVKRTQLKRSEYKIFGKMEKKEADEVENVIDDSKIPERISRKDAEEYDEEIFDDTDFYHQLLRELIDKRTKASSSDDPHEMGRKFMELHKLKVKTKKFVDTKASKGRKVRYNTHEKLVNFMVPIEVGQSTHEARDELFKSLFQSN